MLVKLIDMTEQNEKIRPILIGMQLGETHPFPIEKLKSVRTQASEIFMIYDRKFKTETS